MMLGTGTELDPFIIQDVNDLQAMDNDLDAYYELGNDIDAIATSGWNGGKGFIPIGTYVIWHPELAFSGAFDGKGYSITGLYINRPAEWYVGLFGYGWSHWLRNVEFIDCNITGSWWVAALVGLIEANGISGCDITTPVSNVSVIGQITGTYGVGGLLGGSSGVVSDCHSSATVYGAGIGMIGEVGGLIGSILGDVDRCYCTGDVIVTGNAGYLTGAVGGFGGYIHENIGSCIVNRCYCTGDVTVTGSTLDSIENIGGFGGECSPTSIINCYSRGDVLVDVTFTSFGINVGGFAGSGINIGNSYSTGSVLASGLSDVGGLVGYSTNNTTVVNCFWDTEASGLGTSAGGTGKTTAQMKAKATFTDAGWNFISIWHLLTCNDGYPCLLGVTPLCLCGFVMYARVGGITRIYNQGFYQCQIDLGGAPGITTIARIQLSPSAVPKPSPAAYAGVPFVPGGMSPGAMLPPSVGQAAMGLVAKGGLGIALPQSFPISIPIQLSFCRPATMLQAMLGLDLSSDPIPGSKVRADINPSVMRHHNFGWSEFSYCGHLDSDDAMIKVISSAIPGEGVCGILRDVNDHPTGGPIVVMSGTTGGDYSYMIRNILYGISIKVPATWNKRRRVKFNLYFEREDKQLIRAGIGKLDTDVGRKVAFEIAEGVVTGMVADGSSLSNTSETASIGAGETHTFEIDFQPTIRARFYFDDVLLGEITDYLPAGTVDAVTVLAMYVETTDNTYQPAVLFDAWNFIQEGMKEVTGGA